MTEYQQGCLDTMRTISEMLTDGSHGGRTEAYEETLRYLKSEIERMNR